MSKVFSSVYSSSPYLSVMFPFSLMEVLKLPKLWSLKLLIRRSGELLEQMLLPPGGGERSIWFFGKKGTQFLKTSGLSQKIKCGHIRTAHSTAWNFWRTLPQLFCANRGHNSFHNLWGAQGKCLLGAEGRKIRTDPSRWGECWVGWCFGSVLSVMKSQRKPLWFGAKDFKETDPNEICKLLAYWWLNMTLQVRWY